MRIAEAMPIAHAWIGITTSQLLELEYTAVAAARRRNRPRLARAAPAAGHEPSPQCDRHNIADHGTVTIRTAIHLGSVQLTVENTGDVLTSHVVTTLTEPFQRGTARVRGNHPGVGLGLAIVKSITQAHHGVLTLTPRNAGGLCVTVQLPAAPADGTVESETQHENRSSVKADS
jgi:signal transduction histidine kinase